MRWLLVLVACLAFTSGIALADRITQSFDNDWRFSRGDPAPPPAPLGNYAPITPPSPAFDDSSWRHVNLPHDWAIEGPFDQTAPAGAAGAYLPSGVAWYRKTFTLPPEARGKRISIEFDGVMENAEVYINNALIARHPYGYTPFRCDLTDYLTFSGSNTLAVRTDTSRQPASRFYAGAGIYRHVRMIITDPMHLAPHTACITTPKVAADSATIHVQATVINDSNEVRQVSLMATIHGPPHSAPDGAYAVSGESAPQSLAPGKSADFSFDVPVNWRPRLWSIEQPDMHSASIRVMVTKIPVDEEVIPFGIRTAEFKADTGFWLNGKNIKIKGVCLHQDAGAMGVSVPASAWESRLSALKQLGVNAIRTAHNPPPPEFLDACDRLGLLVMDEAFDAWTVGKETADYHLYFHDHWRDDLSAMIRRDRNHPSIIIYSLGNEIWDILPQNPDPAADQFKGPMRSIDVAKDIFVPMRDLVHQLDPARPVTLAVLRPSVAHAYENGFADLMDVIGQNYRDAELIAAHQQNPARKIIGTENYKTREAWLTLRDNPAYAGQFLWAGVDYLGESGRWPNVIAGAGLLDHTNAPKPDAFERAAWWSDAPVVHIVRVLTPAGRGRGNTPTATGVSSIPAARGRGPGASADWSPANTQSHNETVNVYSNCDQVELFLNDLSLGQRPKNADDSPRQWQVPFAPGTLRAVGKSRIAGQLQQAASAELHTAGPAARITLTPERTTLPDDWDDIVYVRATITDAAGTPVPTANSLISFHITGPALIAAVDSGATTDHDPFQSTQRHAFQGSCVAILRATADTGQITLTASSDGLSDVSTTLSAAPPVHR